MIEKKYSEKTKFQERFESEESQNLIKPLIPTIIEMATRLIDNQKETISDVYIKDCKKLNIQWISSYEFYASASVSGNDLNTYLINLSYGLPISLYLEAITFSKMCMTEYKKSDYDIIFNTFDYGEGRQYISPKKLSESDLKLALFNYSLSWIYYHEQSHLVQLHGSIYEKYADYNKYNGIINSEWHDSSNEKEEKLIGKNAELRHVCELSADYEAIHHIIGDFIRLKNVIKVSDIWIFVACLTYVYNSFYGSKYEFHNGEAKGTHPDPAIRMRFAFIHIKKILSFDGMAQFFESGKEKQDYMNAIYHAYDVASFYIAHLYHQDFKPEFMKRVSEFDTEDEKRYYQKIAKIWEEIINDIRSNYLGFDNFPFMQL